MKKSTCVLIVALLAAVAGALAAVAIYLNRREKELNEYEQLLFTEEFDDDDFDSKELDELASMEPEAEEAAPEA